VHCPSSITRSLNHSEQWVPLSEPLASDQEIRIGRRPIQTKKALFGASQNIDFTGSLKELVGRVDSNHRPPGPEPWEGPFCTLLQVFAIYPYRAVFFIFSMTSRVFALRWLAAVCRPLLHEKGKKRAKSVK